MQPELSPRQWRCNVLQDRSHWAEASRVAVGLDGFADAAHPKWDEVVEIGDGAALCMETVRYKWWSAVDRKVFSLLEVNTQQFGLCHYYCPVCESFFSPDGTLETKYKAPYFRMCEKCAKIGTEHEVQQA